MLAAMDSDLKRGNDQVTEVLNNVMQVKLVAAFINGYRASDDFAAAVKMWTMNDRFNEDSFRTILAICKEYVWHVIDWFDENNDIDDFLYLTGLESHAAVLSVTSVLDAINLLASQPFELLYTGNHNATITKFFLQMKIIFLAKKAANDIPEYVLQSLAPYINGWVASVLEVCNGYPGVMGSSVLTRKIPGIRILGKNTRELLVNSWQLPIWLVWIPAADLCNLHAQT